MKLHLLCCWNPKYTDLCDPCLQLLALTWHTLMHTQRIDSLSPRKIEMGVQWESRTDCNDEGQGTAGQVYWPGNCSDRTGNIYPIIILFSCLFLPKPPWSLPFPVLVYSPKHPITWLPQTQYGLPIMHTIPLGIKLSDLTGGPESLLVDCWCCASPCLIVLRSSGTALRGVRQRHDYMTCLLAFPCLTVFLCVLLSLWR